MKIIGWVLTSLFVFGGLFLISQDATDDQIEEELAAKAQRMVARKMCFDPMLVVITGLTGIERELADYEYDRIHA